MNVEKQKFKVIFFKTLRDDEPVREYLQLLSDEDKSALIGLLHDLMEFGRLPYPHGRKMSGYKDLYEVRYKKHRILYGSFECVCLLANAFSKKSQKTPIHEIELALRRVKTWQTAQKK